MKKFIKLFLSAITILILMILIDTLQAYVFKRSPFIKNKQNLKGDSWVDNGIIIDTYYCVKEDDTVLVKQNFKSSEFTCPTYKVIYGQITNIEDKYLYVVTLDNINVEKGRIIKILLSSNPNIIGDSKYEIGQTIKINSVNIKDYIDIEVIADSIVILNDNFDEDDDITMTIKDGTLTRSGATIIITDLSGKDNVYGTQYRIDKKVNGNWEQLKYVNKQNYAWTLIGYRVDENNKLQLEMNWENLYGTLDDGEYRIVKDTGVPGDLVNHYFSVEFTLK